MFSGAGTPLNDILTAVQKNSTGRSTDSIPYKNSDTRERGARSSGLGNVSAEDLRDLVSLSEEAQNRLKDGADVLSQALKGDNAANETDVNLLKERIAAAREQVEFLTALLKQGAGPEQAQTIARHIGELGQTLEKIGRDIGVTNIEARTDSITVEAVSLSLSFNQVAQIRQDDGSIAEYRQSLDIELSFVSITASSSSTTATTGPGGLSTALAQEQTSTNIAAQQTVNYEASASISKPAATTSVLDDFRVTAKNFRQLIVEFEKSFTDEERVPLNLYNTMRKMVQAVLQGDNADKAKVDQVA